MTTSERTDALRGAFIEILAEGLHAGYRKAIDCEQAMPIWQLIREMPNEDWGAYVEYVGGNVWDWVVANAATPPADATGSEQAAGEGE